MAKYIIDIPDEVRWIQYIQQTRHGTQNLKVECVCDLTPYTEPDREAIENEVWKVLEAIMNEDDLDYPSNFDNCFHENCWEDVFKKHTYREVKANYEAWKKQKDEIHVGDEVTICGQKRVVTSIDDKDAMAIDSDGNTYGFRSIGFYDEATKTGRHFPEVAELLKKMREECEE